MVVGVPDDMGGGAADEAFGVAVLFGVARVDVLLAVLLDEGEVAAVVAVDVAAPDYELGGDHRVVGRALGSRPVLSFQISHASFTWPGERLNGQRRFHDIGRRGRRLRERRHGDAEVVTVSRCCGEPRPLSGLHRLGRGHRCSSMHQTCGSPSLDRSQRRSPWIRLLLTRLIRNEAPFAVEHSHAHLP